jgi:hypothetical protein
MNELSYFVHGIGVKLVTKSSAIGEILSHFSDIAIYQKVPTSIDVRVDLHAVADLNHIPSPIVASKRDLILRKGKRSRDVKKLKLIYDFYHDHGKMVLDLHQHGLVYIDGPHGQAHAYLVQPEFMEFELREFFLGMGICELLRWKGLYVIHAVALERFGKGIMIAGKPGLGKTTAGLSLLRAGYGFISDDFPILRAKEKQVELLTYHDRIDVREKTLGFFPELQTISLTQRDGSSKNSFYVNDLFPGTKVNCCPCNLVLFPHVVPEKRSYLEPIPKYQALKELLPQGLQVQDKEIAKREFQLYSTLVEHTPCYRLHYGEDRWDLAALLDPILDGSGVEAQPMSA